MASRKLAGSHSLRMGRERMLCPHGIYVYGYGRMGIAYAFPLSCGSEKLWEHGDDGEGMDVSLACVPDVVSVQYMTKTKEGYTWIQLC